MGRKSKAAKLEARATVVENPIPTVEVVNVEPEVHKNSVDLPSSKKASKGKSVIIRRSGRLQNSAPPTHNQGIEPMAVTFNLVESDKEDEPQAEQSKQMPGEASFAEKLNYLFQNVEELKSKATNKQSSSDGPCTDINYRSLYIDSQKKNEALKHENLQLAKKLEFALGKVEAYEKVNDVMESLKEVILVSNLGKATGAVIDISSQAVFGRFSPPRAETQALPKRKKLAIKSRLSNQISQELCFCSDMETLTLETENIGSDICSALGLNQSSKEPQVLSLLSSILERSVQRNEMLLETKQIKDDLTIFHGSRAPSLGIRLYIERIFKYSCCSPSCFVVAHIYVDRFIWRTSCHLTSLNVHRLLITSVMLAAKFVDDAFFNNAYYAKVGGISTTELNKLEMKFLFGLDFRLHVSVQKFEKYCLQLGKEATTGGLQIERPLPIKVCRVKESWSNKDDSTCASTVAR
ncbi:unnamed protein product [Ilex paraguariensis]|uniref:Cyclin n=1 Tax=Ilex paraguariensis TaxID=185542 RepID=A0ABC8S1G6_9AQUA